MYQRKNHIFNAIDGSLVEVVDLQIAKTDTEHQPISSENKKKPLQICHTSLSGISLTLPAGNHIFAIFKELHRLQYRWRMLKSDDFVAVILEHEHLKIRNIFIENIVLNELTFQHKATEITVNGLFVHEICVSLFGSISCNIK